ncbi:UDP-N-acetylenolpyruvoylglucosamine reductase [bioreactor metagenome]|uniref:UDP-N-acetylmuramate dehydrogenase n=1 Tax=bioreactor metagenome TaxID=1076179 RepID=A0A644YE58_9ZZZZ
MHTNVRNSDEKINLDQLLLKQVPLAQYSSIHTGGVADLAAYPSDFEELRELLDYARENKLPITVLGGGTNSLISDEGIEGLTIITSHLKRRHVQGEMFCVRCGLGLDRAIDLAIEDGLTGLELLGGLPGTVGGAIHGNSSAHGTSISDLLYYVDYMTFDGKLHRKQIHLDEFSYRRSPFTDRHDIILYEAGFRLYPTTQTSEARKKKDEVKHRRKTNGQYDNPSIGSIFVNPEGYKAGALIEQCNLKGYSIGGAQISHRHANMIINSNAKATSSDIKALIEHVRQEVQQQFQITLVEEIQYLGRW